MVTGGGRSRDASIKTVRYHSESNRELIESTLAFDRLEERPSRRALCFGSEARRRHDSGATGILGGLGECNAFQY